jgi:hypothetical protein
MKILVLILTIPFILLSCDFKETKLKFTNNSDKTLDIRLSDSGKIIRDAQPTRIVHPYEKMVGLGILNYKWDWVFKNNRYTKLYIVDGILYNDSIKDNSPQILKIIYLKKDSLDAVGWKLEYP